MGFTDSYGCGDTGVSIDQESVIPLMLDQWENVQGAIGQRSRDGDDFRSGPLICQEVMERVLYRDMDCDCDSLLWICAGAGMVALCL